MKGYKEFAEKHELVLTSQKVSQRKDRLMGNAEMDHWDCTLMYEGSTYGFLFFKRFDLFRLPRKTGGVLYELRKHRK